MLVETETVHPEAVGRADSLPGGYAPFRYHVGQDYLHPAILERYQPAAQPGPSRTQDGWYQEARNPGRL